MASGSEVDHSDAVYEEREYRPGFAIRLPADPEARYRMDAGLAFSIREYDGYEAFESRTWGMDAGARFSIRLAVGRLGVGLAYRDLKSPRIEYPEGREYEVPGWVEPSLEWTSAARILRLHVSAFFEETRNDPEYVESGGDRGLAGWEIEVRPWEWLALKNEAVRIPGHSSLGLVLYSPRRWGLGETRLEANFGHDRLDPFALPIPFLSTLFGGGQSYGSVGWLLGLSLSAGV